MLSHTTHDSACMKCTSKCCMAPTHFCKMCCYVRPRVPHCNMICQHVCEFGEICISGECRILQEALRSRTQYTVAVLKKPYRPWAGLCPSVESDWLKALLFYQDLVRVALRRHYIHTYSIFYVLSLIMSAKQYRASDVMYLVMANPCSMAGTF
jgi:hypothetical protein